MSHYFLDIQYLQLYNLQNGITSHLSADTSTQAHGCLSIMLTTFSAQEEMTKFEDIRLVRM